MAVDQGSPNHSSLTFKIVWTISVLFFLGCMLLWLQQLQPGNDQEPVKHSSASPPPPKPVQDSSFLFLTKRSESHGCCPISGLPWDARLENGTLRPKQMAFIIGSQKSGTSFMFAQLMSRHPRIKSQRKPGLDRTMIKESHYFDRVAMSPFTPFIDLFDHQDDPLATYIDATPDYMHIPSAACRIADAFPDAKLVILLKDPVQRALSGWNMIRYKGKSKGESVGSFASEMREEISLLRGFGCSYEASTGLRESQKSSSHYNDTLQATTREVIKKKADVSRRQLAHYHTVSQKLPAHYLTVSQQLPAGLNGTLGKKMKLKEGRAKGRQLGDKAKAGPFKRGWRMIKKTTEMNHESSNSSSSSWIVSPDPSSRPYKPWPLPPDVPSWNECFTCTFSYCSAYNNDPPGPPGTCRQDLGRGAIRRGLYAYQLEWWLRHFRPEQLLIVNYEEVQANLEGAFDRVVTFLGQDPNIKKQVNPKVTKQGYKTPYSDIKFSSEDIMALDELYRYYRTPNEDLYRLLESLPEGSTYGWFEPPATPQWMATTSNSSSSSDGSDSPSNSSLSSSSSSKKEEVKAEGRAVKRMVRPERRFPSSFSKDRVSSSQALLFGGA